MLTTRRVQFACPGVLTPSMERSLNMSDESIGREDSRQRSELKRQAALHLSDLRREMVTPLQSLWLKGEDVGRLVR
jgi:hypothetical protein